MAKNRLNVLLIGGSGRWSEANHIPNILGTRSRTSVVVSAICDTRDPRGPWSGNIHPNLETLLKRDNSIWVQAGDIAKTLAELSKMHTNTRFDLVIIASGPTSHYEYALWALKNGISVVCDKPVLVYPGAANDTHSAKEIVKSYDRLVAEYRHAKRTNPAVSFSLLLRRRTLPAFEIVAERLKAVHDKYGAPISHMTIINNASVYRYPDEFIGYGAHDFTHGVGVLSHSAYHYVDLLTWYLSQARGNIEYIVPRLTSVLRVKDYLDQSLYRYVQDANAHSLTGRRGQELPEAVLACELNTTYTMGLYDNTGRLVGDVNFINNSMTMTHKMRDKMPSDDRHDEGRASHIYVDIEQSGLQSMQIDKVEVGDADAEILLRLRSHQQLKEFKNYEASVIKNAYTRAPNQLGSLLDMVIDSLVSRTPIACDRIVDLEDDRSSIHLFSKMYELVANDYRTNGAVSGLSGSEDRLSLI